MDLQTANSVTLPLSSITTLAIEHWRLSNCLAGVAGDSAGPARHALRRIGDILKECAVEAVSLDGKPFDPGMAAEVIDKVDDPALPAGVTLVDETISPLVLCRGKVMKAAQIVTRAAANESTESSSR